MSFTSTLGKLYIGKTMAFINGYDVSDAVSRGWDADDFTQHSGVFNHQQEVVIQELVASINLNKGFNLGQFTQQTQQQFGISIRGAGLPLDLRALLLGMRKNAAATAPSYKSFPSGSTAVTIASAAIDISAAPISSQLHDFSTTEFAVKVKEVGGEEFVQIPLAGTLSTGLFKVTDATTLTFHADDNGTDVEVSGFFDEASQVSYSDDGELQPPCVTVLAMVKEVGQVCGGTTGQYMVVRLTNLQMDADYSLSMSNVEWGDESLSYRCNGVFEQHFIGS